MVLEGFIVFEGIDGSGTTTQLERVSSRLLGMGIAPFKTNEPTDGPIGRLLRECLSGKQDAGQEDLARLFAADRAAHLDGPNGIRSALARGDIVLCDRYLFSSLAYQSLGADPLLPFALNALFPLPQILFFLDIEPETSFGRLSNRSELEIFETLPFQRKVANRYRQIIDLFADSAMEIHRIDASAPVDEVERRIWDRIEPLVRSSGGGKE